jgi:Ser/Thr protein kinase RdoA (MazF antagonist)
MSLFETHSVDEEEVRSLVLQLWGLVLAQKPIKKSQNHTFEALREVDGERFAVRITPDPAGKELRRLEREVSFINYAASKKVHHVCDPVKNREGKYIHTSATGLNIIVFNWAKGALMPFLEDRWMIDADFVFAWGRWLAELHVASRAFSVDFPEVASEIQNWDEIHKSILKDSEIHPDDAAVVHDPMHFGVLHGDLNISNFFYVEEEKTLSVFDFDQCQRGWYLWDLAQSCHTVHMLHDGGSLVDGSVVAAANPAAFEGWIVAGYESVSGPDSVDRCRLSRMLTLRMHFYEKFCRRAKLEGSIPPDMEYFINYIVGYIDKKRQKDELDRSMKDDK